MYRDYSSNGAATGVETIVAQSDGVSGASMRGSRNGNNSAAPSCEAQAQVRLRNPSNAGGVEPVYRIILERVYFF